ncbi:hypothetical protein [Brevibacillus sp. SYSU BS000544]|uniref:hypothetical protein n=1 Tax=Brevibacillus sp. SYSU BS000544 TaxID=3416443 RepID=UPI003CE5AD95
MRLNKKSILMATILGMTIFVGQVWADGVGAPGVPGSSDDPVVTKSYVDQKIQQVLGTGGSKLVVAELKPGKTIYGFEGTEFIVRTGKVVSVPGVNGDGLTDITAGADLKAGAPVAPNHLLLIARSDSRGLRLDPGYKGTAHIMVRGKFEIR